MPRRTVGSQRIFRLRENLTVRRKALRFGLRCFGVGIAFLDLRLEPAASKKYGPALVNYRLYFCAVGFVARSGGGPKFSGNVADSEFRKASRSSRSSKLRKSIA